MDKEQLACIRCGKSFKEGQKFYVYIIDGLDRYFCSKKCVHDWVDEEMDSYIYHREDFKDWLD